MVERWLPVVGYEGWYEVSDEGRIASVDRWIGNRFYHGKLLSTGADVRKGPVVSLHRCDGGRTRRVAVLMLEAFVGPKPHPDFEACHADDDKRHNRLENLRWDSQSENTNDMVRNGRHNNARKTKCKYGHKFTPANTRVYRGGRICVQCANRRNRQYRRARNGDEDGARRINRVCRGRAAANNA